MRALWSVAVCAIAISCGFSSYAADMQQDRMTCMTGPSYETVVKACTSVIERSTVHDTELANAFVRRGNAHLDNNAFDLARDDYSEAIKIEPTNLYHYISRGRTNFAEGKFKDAIEDINHALRIRPGDADIYFMRGAVFDRDGDFEHALADYTEAIRLQPTNTEFINNRGLIYSKHGEHERAILDFNRVIELDPQHAFAFNNRGNIHLYRADPENALQDYSRSLEIDPNYDVALANRCWVRALLSDDLDAAIEDCSRASVFGAPDSDVARSQGLIYLRMGRLTDAIVAFDAVLAVVHDDYEAQYLRGIARLRAGDIANGNSDIAAAIASFALIAEYFAQFGVIP